MKILLNQNCFPVPSKIEIKSYRAPWYLRILGFNLSQQAQIQDEPVAVAGGYSYTVKLVSYTWTWCGIKLNTKKYEM